MGELVFQKNQITRPFFLFFSHLLHWLSSTCKLGRTETEVIS
uniref:Uncharacterized protein n=1 Tax=Rhizophora mucronata TaxID=61149 RepID=A0A2P2NYJ1_RHIMU